MQQKKKKKPNRGVTAVLKILGGENMMNTSHFDMTKYHKKGLSKSVFCNISTNTPYNKLVFGSVISVTHHFISLRQGKWQDKG